MEHKILEQVQVCTSPTAFSQNLNHSSRFAFFLDAIASHSTYPCQSVGQSVSESFIVLLSTWRRVLVLPLSSNTGSRGSSTCTRETTANLTTDYFCDVLLLSFLASSSTSSWLFNFFLVSDQLEPCSMSQSKDFWILWLPETSSHFSRQVLLQPASGAAHQPSFTTVWLI